MFLAEPQHTAVASPEILIVGGGKGGSGKTCFSANLAVEIARKGWRVIVVDADLGCSNLDLVLGVRSPHSLDEFFNEQGCTGLEHFLCDTPFENLRIVAGASGALDIANPRYQQRLALIRELKRLDADLVIIDLDAGTHLNTLDLFLMAETSGVLVITPEDEHRQRVQVLAIGRVSEDRAVLQKRRSLAIAQPSRFFTLVFHRN